ncbi:alkaline ceramidase family protein [Karstenula rhodostoma CBS 690.94]|uniref:Alkaline ceramidase family protein n=1 Tax=Karstenula rhodostoma CBS 690.94 TaxID=1392251 RepID=A0A9P4PPD4_9PLEO|nr:alkaline ceramidase family protein [Karstenula rhodostoma CBS 690.94]
MRWDYAESPGRGAWGTPSSRSNFCEEDYVITQYIAEFVNTLTNLTYVIYGIYGLRRVGPHKDGGLFSTLASPYWGLIGVGVLSAWFHATLKYHSQMGDDLSMFLAVGAVLNQLQIFNQPPATRRTRTLLIVGILIPVSVYHCWADEIYVHQITFAAMVLLCGRQIRKLIHERIPNAEQKSRLLSLTSGALATGLLGYFLWNIDEHFCEYVTALKHTIGLPWAFVFELHGWWHIFTGIGAYVGMAVVEYLVTIEDGKTDKIEEGFVWPVSAVLRNLDAASSGRKTI